MVSSDNLLRCSDWKLPLTVHTDASDKQLGAFISQNIKPIAFFSSKLIKQQRNYAMTEKDLLKIVKCLKQFRRIIFGYDIKIFSYRKNLVHAATLSESQKVMRLRLIIEEFGPNIQQIYGVDNP